MAPSGWIGAATDVPSRAELAFCYTQWANAGKARPTLKSNYEISEGEVARILIEDRDLDIRKGYQHIVTALGY